ncbi:MAG: hypothetical protein JNK85_09645 [Verrucomicrobiales bacterium]|nr:hypothetical protein [Verrucomicrobiales bacterium]
MEQRDRRDQRDPTRGWVYSGAWGYQNLLSFQKARIVFDGTVHFCEHHVDRRSRTHDQMIQAARSGKQSILEGSQASGTSKETEIKLTSYLLDRQLHHLEQEFLRTGGLRERMWQARLRTRRNSP